SLCRRFDSVLSHTFLQVWRLWRIGSRIGLWFRHSWVRFPSVAPYHFLLRGCSLVVKPQPSKLMMSVRFRSPAPLLFHSSSVVELSAVNRSVVGSNPTCGAIRPLGQAVKTPPFHGGNTGSSPVGVI